MKRSIFLLLLSPLSLFALGGKPEVIKGLADYEATESMEVVRVSDKTILEYQKFNLEKQETTKYEQPSSKSTLLCRVKGSDPSMIRGKLEANGKLLFINPNGIIFSETAHINVGTLIASTLDIQNDDFLNGRYKFTLTPEALETAIVNKGCIEATHNVVFMASHIFNHGVISAKAGKIALMGGEVMTLDFDGDEMIQFAVETPLKNGYIEQGGELAASQVHMKLPMAQKAIQSVLNDTGVIEAGYIEIAEGMIFLKAGSYTQAKALHISGDMIQIGEELKIAGLCELHANRMILQSTVDAGSIHLVGHEPLSISHPLTAHTGDFIIDAPLLFDSSETVLQALHGRFMRFEKPLSGHTKLTLHAPEGEIILQGSLRGAKKFQQINLFAQKITQHETVVSIGPVHYTADQIFLGHDITTDNAITLEGRVTLFKNDAIHLTANKYNKGPILLTSTLDADGPGRTLIFQNEKSPTQIKGAIGKNGALGNLVINSGKIIFHDDIGGVAPGITGRLTMKSVGIECKGSTYYTGEQLWNTARIHLTHEGGVELKTDKLPLQFGPDAKIELDKTTAFAVRTQGGLLDLAPIISGHSQPIIIQTEQGEAHLKEIGKKVTILQVEGRDVLLSGHLEADQIFMEADDHIAYDLTKGKEIISTAFQSQGTITLNSKRGTVGTAEKPLNIETKSHLYVGAKTVAYLEGKCADQNPHVYPPNPPPRTFFNGYEFNYLFINDLGEDDALLKTLTPALSQKTPTAFMDGTGLNPRKAPIYYDTSSK